MRERLHLDVYNIIIVSLIPVMMLTAWGVTIAYERNLRAEQCEQAITYFQDAADISELYTNADSLDAAEPWLDRLQALSYPEPLRGLHNGADSAFTFATSVGMNVDMDEPAALYERLPTFQDVLDEGRETIVNQCPETEPMVAGAFPMFFRQEGQE